MGGEKRDAKVDKVDKLVLTGFVNWCSVEKYHFHITQHSPNLFNLHCIESSVSMTCFFSTVNIIVVHI